MRNLPLRVQNLLGLLIVRAGRRGGHSWRTTFRQPFVTPFQALGFAERLSANVAFQVWPLHLGDGKFPLTRSRWLSGFSLQIVRGLLAHLVLGTVGGPCGRRE